MDWNQFSFKQSRSVHVIAGQIGINRRARRVLKILQTKTPTEESVGKNCLLPGCASGLGMSCILISITSLAITSSNGFFHSPLEQITRPVTVQSLLRRKRWPAQRSNETQTSVPYFFQKRAGMKNSTSILGANVMSYSPLDGHMLSLRRQHSLSK